MSSLGVQSSLEVLERLRGALADFAARELQLTRALQSRRAGHARRFGADTGEAGLAEQLAAARVALEEEEAHARAAIAARRARIETVSGQVQRGLPRRARGAREAWLGELQRQLRTAENLRAAQLQAAGNILKEQTARLTEAQAQLTALETGVRQSLASYAGARPAEAFEPPASDEEEDQLLASLEESLAEATEHLQAFQQYRLLGSFRSLPLVVWAFLGLVLGALAALLLGFTASAWLVAGAIAGVVFFAALGAWLAGRSQARPAAVELNSAVAQARARYEAARGGSGSRHEQKSAEAQAEFEASKAAITEQWDRAPEVEKDFAAERRAKLAEQTARLQARLARVSHPRLKALAAERFTRLERMEQEGRARLAETAGEGARDLAQLEADEAARWQALETAWQQATGPLFQSIAALEAEAAARTPAWSEATVESWAPAASFPAAIKIAQLEVHAPELAETLPRDPRLALPRPHFTLPLALTFPQQGSLLFETRETAGAVVDGCLNNLILRLLAAAPPGKITFTVIDPVGLGQNFAGLMHLSDYEESLINRRIWTQPGQIEERLAELNEHIEKVIQMYLRNEYATITEYNAKAGSVAEKYHFLVAADFPAGFSETAARRLQSIATSGPRCGVFTLLHWDRRRPLPEGLVADDLRTNSVVLSSESGRVDLARLPATPGVTFHLDPAAAPELAATLVHRIGKASIDSSRVEVPFSQIAPPPGELWQSSTTQELRVPIGRTGATKLQYLAIGKGTRQHALFAGKTGSGKSTLFHVIITNLALWCSPEQVEFYLIDFKKGVEFKCYADQRLPHARVVAIESDREFALSVLQRVDEELRRRGDLFRKLGVQDVAGYQRVTAEQPGREPMPRTLLIIDEFQEFFVEDDPIAQGASLLFDRIVRQGRAFGIHVLLGSQTLGGAYTLARATLGQMVIRVALQCNEADAYLIMDENNAAPRLLSRPGEGIYNDSAGAVEGNSPFQVVWLADEERDRWLHQVRDRAARQEVKYPSPIVFEGNSPAEVRDNDLLARSLAAEAPLTAAPRCWLGAPNSIKGPTEAVFHRQSGNHLLIVGQHDEATFTMLSLSLLALAAQYPAGRARFVFFLSAGAGSAEALALESLADARPGQVKIVTPPESTTAMAELAAELAARLADEEGQASAPPIFIFIQGLHRFKKLRQEEDFSFSSSDDGAASPGAQFGELMLEGSAHGLHLLCAVDTFNSVNRFINRKALSEWEMRVVFQMSANDSASLIDSPAASNLGLHRAIFYNERAGSLETFRPYAMPDEAWLTQATAQLSARPAASAPVQGPG